MKSIKLFILFIFVTGIASSVYAQSSEEAEVQATIETLFEGMLEADAQKVINTFYPDAIMQTMGTNSEGLGTVQKGNLQSFLQGISSAEPGRLNEKILRFEIKVDGPLASVWTPYEFYIGENFSHCGVNSFQLVKMGNGWKIFHIVDTRRQDNCVE